LFIVITRKNLSLLSKDVTEPGGVFSAEVKNLWSWKRGNGIITIAARCSLEPAQRFFRFASE
jgi:hypothetical protein